MLHRPSYASLIREHREVVRRMELGSQGAIFLEADDEHARPHVPKLKPVRTYSVVRDGNDGYGVRCDQTHHFVNEEPIETEAKANLFLDELEAAEEAAKC